MLRVWVPEKTGGEWPKWSLQNKEEEVIEEEVEAKDDN